MQYATLCRQLYDLWLKYCITQRDAPVIECLIFNEKHFHDVNEIIVFFTLFLNVTCLLCHWIRPPFTRKPCVTSMRIYKIKFTLKSVRRPVWRKEIVIEAIHGQLRSSNHIHSTRSLNFFFLRLWDYGLFINFHSKNVMLLFFLSYMNTLNDVVNE